jgi:alpha-galactosidase
MPIAWSADGREFHLRNDLISYAVGVNPNGSLGNRYFGPALAADRTFGHIETPAFEGFANRVGDPVALECPTTGSGDYRVPALTVELADGSGVLELAYVEHRVRAGKPGRPPEDAWVTYVESDEEAETLEIVLADERSASPSSCRTRSSATGPSWPEHADPQ